MDYYQLNHQIEILKQAREVFRSNNWEISNRTIEDTDDLIEKLTEERDSL